ncbi:hypothetical protein [Steroidobacter sp.]|uniref:hypothetical protein n=1 Tax=Steroidobacter sp. TaxID=1978227 RepID=UPI002EDB010B
MAVAIVTAGLGFGAAAGAETPRAEELEQLRINTAYIIEAGEFEIDIVPFYFDYDDGEHLGVEAEFEYAISERFMVEIEIPYHRVSTDDGHLDGTGNVEVAGKWLLTEQGGFAMAFNLGVELPASDEIPGVAEDAWGVEVTTPISLHFPDRYMRVHIEPGVQWQEHEGFEEQLLNLAVEHRPGGGNIALQLGSNIVREEGEVEAYLVPSFEVSATTVPFQFGMAVAAGLTSESADWGLLLDFEVEF